MRCRASSLASFCALFLTLTSCTENNALEKCHEGSKLLSVYSEFPRLGEPRTLGPSLADVAEVYFDDASGYSGTDPLFPQGDCCENPIHLAWREEPDLKGLDPSLVAEGATTTEMRNFHPLIDSAVACGGQQDVVFKLESIPLEGMYEIVFTRVGGGDDEFATAVFTGEACPGVELPTEDIEGICLFSANSTQSIAFDAYLEENTLYWVVIETLNPTRDDNHDYILNVQVKYEWSGPQPGGGDQKLADTQLGGLEGPATAFLLIEKDQVLRRYK